ncbi:M20 family metallopeptidase [Xanthobacter tagetidis]|uniref:M20 peptidase family dipeptidase n=1 Tax=Xanthobacter tagetidis TaxID=60216 RepID=A0A3L6ZYC0_9HYPH|nr:M20 family metallopeptidase [Xanthobacter tagetidis]MBB6310235.1 acetylornithine deacetylase/succinyl-diaminopimelate desuccinylase-like protein [Xanthobacter tagetidis]RLP72804.1 M20 peptidase family dipeptidase [Xanthobacter tagetidis]
MSRQEAVTRAADYFDRGDFRRDLARRVAMPTESQTGESIAALGAYLTEEMIPTLEKLGFACRVVENSAEGYGPFLIAERHEAEGLPTVLTYGHGDVVFGQDGGWREGLAPWTLVEDGDRWYGRGTADNKGQHSINITALEQVMAARGGRLGFNCKMLIEMGEEAGSPGLRELAQREGAALAADLLIGSDGPRLSAVRPTVFLGSRGAVNFELEANLREGGHHSGNWGGALANAGTLLANAIASLVDAKGRILVDGLRPKELPSAVRQALSGIALEQGMGDPEVDPDWGEPGLTPAERVYGWNALEVLAFQTGAPDKPANAVPPTAKATLQLRFVVGTDPTRVIPLVEAHLAARGLGAVTVRPARSAVFQATRLDPTDPWVKWALASIQKTTGKAPALLPNLGGSLPNDVFALILGMPTIWVPHSYPACSQHAPNEHLLGSVAREALQLMAGLFYDLGEEGMAILKARAA